MQKVDAMELLTVVFVLVTCVLCAALAAAAFMRPTTFEQVLAAQSAGPEPKRKKKEASIIGYLGVDCCTICLS